MRLRPLLKFAIVLTAVIVVSLSGAAQPMPGTKDNKQDSNITEGMELKPNTMNPKFREKISDVAETYHRQREGLTRNFLTKTLEEAKFSLGSSLIDIVVNEVFSIAKYKKQQRANWEAMIRNECNYTDSILSINGNTDFYSENSFYGPLDPSDINFDGITLTNSRGGQQFFYVECHIDTTRIEHLFRHSKFYLVLDSVYFNPYLCHLPNLKANNIIIDKEAKEQPTRNTNFSFDERSDLKVSIDLTLTSSWINEAVMVMQDVELGKFSFTINIPSTKEGQPYVYSRANATKPIDIKGESFIVPRSYMPLADNVRMWGTGEYKMKVCFRESCSFGNKAEPGSGDQMVQDQQSKKDDFNWKEDYKRLRQMQKQSSGLREIAETMYKQEGNTIYKTLVKSVTTSTLTELNMVESTGGGGGGAMP